jgi:restriction system protein
MAKQKQAEFLKWMGPCLDALRKLGGSGTPHEVSDSIAEEFNLPDEKREELTSSGIPRFHNQVCWARQYLVWEGYIESSKRGIWKLDAFVRSPAV